MCRKPNKTGHKTQTRGTNETNDQKKKKKGLAPLHKTRTEKCSEDKNSTYVVRVARRW
jgi:hypothetical protein